MIPLFHGFFTSLLLLRIRTDFKFFPSKDFAAWREPLLSQIPFCGGGFGSVGEVLHRLLVSGLRRLGIAEASVARGIGIFPSASENFSYRFHRRRQQAIIAHCYPDVPTSERRVHTH